MRPTFYLAPLLLLGWSLPAAAQTVGIAGSGLGCLFTSVDLAAGLAAPGEILYLKAGTVFNEAVDLNKDVTLRAGNATCDGEAAANDPRPIIDGQFVRRPISVGLGAVAVIDRVDLANGSATEGGNVIVEEGDLTITDATVYLGVADHGGGLYVAEGASLTLGEGAVVSWNTANDEGGGVYVAGELDVLNGAEIGDVFLGNGADVGGGIYVASGTATLYAGGAIIGNAASRGGGVDVAALGRFEMLGGRIGGPNGEGNQGNGIAVAGEVLVLGGEVAYNSADEGGGIVVFGSGSGAVLAAAWIHHNEATWGGGIGLHEASSFTLEGRVTDNTASKDGGGVSVANVYGALEFHGANILRNVAGERGGGVELHYAQSASFVSTWINENVAGLTGGGVYVAGSLGGTGNAIAISGPRTAEEDCEYRGTVGTNRYCSEIRNNQAERGGGWASGAHGTTTIRETGIIGNVATIEGAAMLLSDPGASPLSNAVDLKNVLLTHNESPDADVVRVEDGAQLTAAHVTMTRNVGTPLHYLPAALGDFRRSIVWEQTTSVIDAPFVLPAACTAFNAVTGGTSGVNRSFGVNPQFVTTARGNYRLDPVASPNSVDQCSAGAMADLDSDPRPAGPLTLWDRGAFEAQ